MSTNNYSSELFSPLCCNAFDLVGRFFVNAVHDDRDTDRESPDSCAFRNVFLGQAVQRLRAPTNLEDLEQRIFLHLGLAMLVLSDRERGPYFWSSMPRCRAISKSDYDQFVRETSLRVSAYLHQVAKRGLIEMHLVEVPIAVTLNAFARENFAFDEAPQWESALNTYASIFAEGHLDEFVRAHQDDLQEFLRAANSFLDVEALNGPFLSREERQGLESDPGKPRPVLSLMGVVLMSCVCEMPLLGGIVDGRPGFDGH